MSASGEQTQHASGVFGVLGLAEDFLVRDDDSVGAEDEESVSRGIAIELVEDGLRLFLCEAGDEGGWVLVGTTFLWNVCGDNFELVASLGEEFFAAGRG